MGFIKGLLKFIGVVLLVVVVAVGATLAAARFADGPWAIISGGPFKTGQLAPYPADWSFVKDIDTVEFQLVEPETSRTTWIMEHNNRAFIPSGYMDTGYGKIWKQWPLQAEDDGRAILRIDGKLFNVRLMRIMDDPDLEAVLSEVSRKYVGQPVPKAAVTSGSLWIFELLRR